VDANRILYGMGVPALWLEEFYSTRCANGFSALRGNLAGIS
jgi:hypothetical protein